MNILTTILFASSCAAYAQEIPEKLSSDISNYVQGKQVILFGEDHSELKREDARLFTEYIPQLKQAGFTHIGLEIDEEYQKDIHSYRSNTVDALQGLDYPKHIVEDWEGILDVAQKYDLEVLCLDTAQGNRDGYMKKRIDRVLKRGGKIAVFIGAKHASSARRVSLFPFSLGYFRPLGNYLVLKYRSEEIGLVNLNGCLDQDIYTCVEEE